MGQIADWADAERTLCDGQAFGFGESSARYKLKEVTRGGITCHRCMSIIKEIKAIKL